MKIKTIIADKSHVKYAHLICETIAESAKIRGTGIAKRTPEYISSKIEKGNAVIALEDDVFVGFCYIEIWGEGKFVANSGLIVNPDYRGMGMAKRIKKRILEHSLQKFPNAKIFGITTGLAVMKINYELGYKPVSFSELTNDPAFWNGCKTCKNYDILQRTEQKMCLCTGMLYEGGHKGKSVVKDKVFSRLKRIKQGLFLNKNKNNKNK